MRIVDCGLKDSLSLQSEIRNPKSTIGTPATAGGTDLWSHSIATRYGLSASTLFPIRRDPLSGDHDKRRAAVGNHFRCPHRPNAVSILVLMDRDYFRYNLERNIAKLF
jgi:hypothetical protein